MTYIIDVIDKTEGIPAEKKNEMIAEAKCLRGMFLYVVYDLFGPFHVTLDPSEINDIEYMPRPSKEEYRSWIIKDFEDALPNLPGKTNNTDGSSEFPNGPQRHCLRRMSVISSETIPMSYRLEHALSPWVNFVIMPLFALANAGVVIPDLSYFNVFHVDPALGGVSMGIFLGLLLGKPLGISLASYIAVKLHAGEMPANASWKMLIAVACLGGIGFTMPIAATPPPA